MAEAKTHRTSRQRTWLLLLLTAILLLAFALRLHWIAFDNVWWDEGFSAWMARKSIPSMLARTSQDTHPPLWYAFLHVWRLLAGEAPFALRLPSAFFGLLTAGVSYQVGREVGGQRVGAAALLLTAVAWLQIWWSQKIRMYTLAAFWSALLVWGSLRLLLGRGRIWRLIGMQALLIGAGLLTFYLFAGTVLALTVAFVVAFVLSARRWRLARAWFVGHLGGLLLATPWMLYAVPRMLSWTDINDPFQLNQIWQLFVGAVFLNISAEFHRYLPLVIVTSVILLAGMFGLLIAARCQQERIAAALLVSFVLLPPLLVYLLQIPREISYSPSPSPRYFMLFSMPVYVLIGWAIVKVIYRWRMAGAALLVGGVVLSGWALTRYYTGITMWGDYESVTMTLSALRQPGDAVVLNNDREWPVFDYHISDAYQALTHTQIVDERRYAEIVLDDALAHEGVWLVQTRFAPESDPQNFYAQVLEDHAVAAHRYLFPEAQLWFYALTPERAAALDSVRSWPYSMTPVKVAPVIEDVRLVGVTQVSPLVRAGGQMVIGLGWQVDTPHAEAEWPVAVQILNRDGSVLVSQPVTLDARAVRRYLPVRLVIPPDASPGPAQIVLVVGPNWAPLDNIHIRPPRHTIRYQDPVPDTATLIDVQFDDTITLLAADLPTKRIYVAGDSIPLTLYWRADDLIAEDYKVFVHLIGSEINPTTGSPLWGQHDKVPRNGLAPTTTWRPGDVLAEEYRVPIDGNTPPGTYMLQVGWYHPLNFSRLFVTTTDSEASSAADAVTLVELQIVGE